MHQEWEKLIKCILTQLKCQSILNDSIPNQIVGDQDVQHLLHSEKEHLVN